MKNLVDLLKRCADALYYVYEFGDPRVFNYRKYEELALECDDAVKVLSGQEPQDGTI
ncbi:MAG: hypothetical protein ACTSQ8_26135 [Candidatus Helarchaeota archaeon]